MAMNNRIEQLEFGVRSAIAVIEALLASISDDNDDDGERIGRAMMAAEGLLRVLRNLAPPVE
jgi:hypothetical protein